MKVKELIKQLLECDMNADVVINDREEISLVWNGSLCERKVNITTCPSDEDIDEMEREEYFHSLIKSFDDMMGNATEVLDALFTNGAR